jgi:hypothetical protein
MSENFKFIHKVHVEETDMNDEKKQHSLIWEIINKKI